MLLFSHSISTAVEQMLQINGQGRTLVTLPSYDGPLMLTIARQLTELARVQHAQLLLKIASQTMKSWQKNDKQVARANGWEDTRGNLTYYRNTLGKQEKRLVVLCGVDKITDTAGLEDFTFCDEAFIWERYDKALFTDWLRIRFEAAGLVLPTDKAMMNKVSDLLDSLRILPSGGLPRISTWLDGMDMRGLHDGSDLLQHILSRLQDFMLPNCWGFSRNCRGKTFMQYAKAAQSFFDYSSFIKFKDRTAALKAVNTALEQLEQDAPPLRILNNRPDEVCPSYPSGKEFLQGILRYIATEDSDDREKLLACDFVTVHDVVLRCRSASVRKSRETPRKLYGPLLETLLTAMWITLETCRRKNREQVLPSPLCLRLCGKSYQFASDGEPGSQALAGEVCEYAKEQLRRLLDGVDILLEKYLHDENVLRVYSRLLPEDNPKATRKTPSFLFRVEIAENPDGPALFWASYEWIIPENHRDRLDAELIRRAADLFKEGGAFLPLYHLPYYEELLNAPDGDDSCEILRHCLRDGTERDFADNLLDKKQIPADDPLAQPVSYLSGAYAKFICHAARHSLYHALFQQDSNGESPWRRLKQAYENALQAGKECVKNETTRLGPALMRAFLFMQQPLSKQDVNWGNSAVVTVLHPALLEQIHAQFIFLCAGFQHIYRQARDAQQGFAPRVLQRYLRMARTHAPLCTLLRTSAPILTSSIRGEGHIHKIGHVEHRQADTLSTRLHSDGDRFQEKLGDSELYAESDESALLEDLLKQYYTLRPHAGDGISLAIFRNTSIQPVIAGLHSFLHHLATDSTYSLANRGTLYDVRLFFFSKSNDAADLRIWLDLWQSRWNTAREEDRKTKNSFYRQCRISVAHQLVRSSQEMEDLLRSGRMDVDIALLYDLLDTGETSCSFKEIAPFDCTSTELKFPILEKKYCVSLSESQELSRSRVVSLRQFSSTSLHADLLAAALRQTFHSASSLVISRGCFQEWKETIALLHDAAEWVICIDPAMDEALIRDSASDGKVRDIIAFGSGVGSHGEANYTVSSEQLSCQDLCDHIGARLACLYGDNAPDKITCRTMAENLLHAKKLTGMGLIRAASLQDTYIHDFLAFSLSRRLLQVPDTLCDTIISLDAYHHWLPSRDIRHPDLLWITGEEQNGRLHLHARLIECKLARSNDNLVWRAHTQLRSGLGLLEPLFRPRGTNELDDARPDRRYWWHQLHRVITSSMYAELGTEAKRIAALLEQLVEGQFSIAWEALLLTYWIDDDGTAPRWTDCWSIDGIPARQCVIGYPLQLRLALEDPSPQIWELAQQQTPCPEQEDQYPEDGPSLPAELAKDDISESVDSLFESDTDDSFDEDDEEQIEWMRTYLAPELLERRPVSSLSPTQKEGVDNSTESSFPAHDPDDETSPREKNISAAGETAALSEDTVAVVSPIPAGGTVCAVSLSEADVSTVGDISLDIPEPEGLPEHILLGVNRSGQPVYWRFRDGVNRHLIIFGSSGNGKTYAIQCLLAELARKQLNTMVLDYSQSFTPSEILPPVKSYFPESEQHIVVAKPLPINPLTRQTLTQLHTEERSYIVAGRVASIFKKIFNLGTQQVNILQDAVIECLEKYPQTTFQHVEQMLEDFRDDGRHNKNSLETLQSHIRSFLWTKPFTEPRDDAGWEKLYKMFPACNHVFQLASIPDVFAAGIIEFVLWDLFFHAQRCGNPAHPSIVVLDEIQNLSLQSGSPVDKILREGRKFGMGLIAATQSFSGVKQSLSTLNQAACKLYFRPADNEMADCGKQLHDLDSSFSASEWKEQLARLKRGECYFIGPTTPPERPVRFVKIASMEDRGFGN